MFTTYEPLDRFSSYLDRGTPWSHGNVFSLVKIILNVDFYRENYAHRQSTYFYININPKHFYINFNPKKAVVFCPSTLIIRS